MIGIILAAGVGIRLGKDLPKCLTEIENASLLERQINALQGLVSSIVIVTGYKKELVEAEAESVKKDMDVKYVYNPAFKDTNTLYSLWLALKHCDFSDGFLLAMADVIADQEVFKRVSSQKITALACVSRCDEEAVKVVSQASCLGPDRVVEIGKKIPLKISFGEFIGIAAFDNCSSEFLLDAMDKRLSKGTEHWKDFCELAINDCITDYPFYICDVSDLKVIEIDFPEDLEKAKALFKNHNE